MDLNFSLEKHVERIRYDSRVTSGGIISDILYLSRKGMDGRRVHTLEENGSKTYYVPLDDVTLTVDIRDCEEIEEYV